MWNNRPSDVFPYSLSQTIQNTHYGSEDKKIPYDKHDNDACTRSVDDFLVTKSFAHLYGYVNSVEVELNLKYFEVEFQRFIIKS